MSPKILPPIPRREYDRVLHAAQAALALLEALETAEAIRLPIIGYPEAKKALQAAVKR